MCGEGAAPPSHPSACSAAYLGQVVEEGPQPQQHGQHDQAGEEACQLEGAGQEQRREGTSPTARETASCLCVSLLESLPPPQTPFHAAVPLSLTPAFSPCPIKHLSFVGFPQDIVQHPYFCSLPPFYYYFF